jgi:carboxyl-terminal processing protease
MRIDGRIWIALAAGLSVGLGASVGGAVLADRTEPSAETLPWEDARLFAEVLERVKADYVDEVDEHKLLEGAVRGMIAQLDPHSAFLDSEEYREIRISTTGNYSGVGLEVNLVDGLVRVVSPIDDTPAQRAGIEPGDAIIAVDGEPVGERLDETVTKLRGETGTKVRLDIRRDGVDDMMVFDLERTMIHVDSVKSDLLEPGIGYVRITQFSETTGRDLAHAFQNLETKNGADLQALILDLRNNPGGVLDAAVEVSDAFLEDGLIVSADGRIDEARFAMSAHPGDLMHGGPIGVLVNGGSASASEIVAGALKDHERALIMGSHTYGKGSVQTVMPLSNGRAIKLTTSRYFTPSGEPIHEGGIQPDIALQADADEVPMEAGDALIERDSILRQALVELKRSAAQKGMLGKLSTSLR